VAHTFPYDLALKNLESYRNLMIAGSNPNDEIVNGTKYHRSGVWV